MRFFVSRYIFKSLSILPLIFLAHQMVACKTKNASDSDSDFMSGFSPDSLVTLSETIFKISPTARNEDDCVITGQHQVKSIGKFVEGHIEIEFTSAVPGCNGDRKKGWIFKGHIMDPKKVATIIRRATIFNLDKKPICVIDPSIVRMLTESLEDGDFVKFRPMPSFIDALPDKCEKIASYYVSKSSFVKGVQAISLAKFAILKVKPIQTDELNKGDANSINSRICYIPPGLYILERPITLEGSHYKIQFPAPINEIPLEKPFQNNSPVLKNPEIAKKIPNGRMTCNFPNNKVGYLWPSQTNFADPNAQPVSDGSAGYYYPLRTGTDPGITSSWCETRNIGTSPHIGTDFGDFPPVLTSQAIYSGKIERVEFLASCGYAVYLADDRGALWRYLHCNRPNLVEGQRVKGGDMMCTHSNYPEPACGGGRHLHLDRFKLGTGYPAARNAPYTGCNLDSENLFMDRSKVNR
ncbi:MAG: M23 family metallopeptidase [Pseudomonadota bacterium]